MLHTLKLWIGEWEPICIIMRTTDTPHPVTAPNRPYFTLYTSCSHTEPQGDCKMTTNRFLGCLASYVQLKRSLSMLKHSFCVFKLTSDTSGNTSERMRKPLRLANAVCSKKSSAAGEPNKRAKMGGKWRPSLIRNR